MKRLVWIFLAAFCTLLAQVPTVSLPVSGHGDACGCCVVKGSCGMPDCAPAPQSSPSAPTVTAVQPALVAAAQAAKAKVKLTSSFYHGFVASPTKLTTVSTAVPPVPAAQAPLFKVHCSFLI